MTAGLDMFRESVTAIDNAQTANDAFEQLCNALEHYGFTSVFARRGELWADETAEPMGLYYAKDMQPFVERYIEKRYIYVDPVVAHLARTNRPYRWRDTQKNLTEEERAYLNVTHQYGLQYGLTIPVVTSPGLLSLVFMGRETDFELDRLDVIQIELLCCFAFEVIEDLLGDSAAPPFKLSQKEHEVLDLVGKGKTNWEIGQIMSISEYSVRDYLKTLSQRFHTSNRTHTVVKAIQLGLLRP